MREIKFRGKCIKTNQWVYGWYVGYSEAMGYIYGDYVDENEVWQVRAESCGQYTGLKDKSGTEIYEGDIVEFLDWKPKEVVWGNKIDKALSGCCGYMLDGTMHFLGENEPYLIIGNIHDNPELVKEELK